VVKPDEPRIALVARVVSIVHACGDTKRRGVRPKNYGPCDGTLCLCPWSGLPNEIASELFASATFYQLKAGDTLFQTGDKGDGCYRLDVGLLKVSLISPQVRERIIAIITPGVVVGDLAVIDGLPRFASVHALTDCELRFLSRAAFERLAQDHPEIHQYLVKLLAARLRKADENIASLAFLPAKAPVAYALLALAENLGKEMDSGDVLIPRIINQGDIAAMAGVARENASRILSEWERKKLVTKSSGSYRVDQAKLKGEINE
jgi:CRP/FNR family cyclic AMP-dependent transcriptional regulator